MLRVTKIVLSSILLSAMTVTADDSLTEITVRAFPPVGEINSAPVAEPKLLPDAAALLASVPGGGVNQNGVITGVAQYRGMFGDRVSVAMDSAPVLTGGPNAMDTPLSYAPVSLLSELSVHRGIAPVRLAQESIGGHISTRLNRGAFSAGDQWAFSGTGTGGYSDNGDQISSGVQLLGANHQQKIALLASHDQGNNQTAGDDLKIVGSQYQRNRIDLSYAWQTPSSSAELFVGHLNTKDSGTPALAMDIATIETDLLGFSFKTDLDNMALSAHIAWSDVFHIMDNYSLRQAPMMAMDYRSNTAQADSLSWQLQLQIPVNLESALVDSLVIGTDGNRANHGSIITNPNNPMFKLVNFNNSQRDIMGLYTELAGRLKGHWQYEAGLRINRVSMASDEVSAAGMMAMMGDHAAELANQFNSADRDIGHNNTDIAVKLSKTIDKQTTVNLGLAVKNRAPSYQESYLWLPLPISAGLADGRSYLGNRALKSERAREINLGLVYSGVNFSVSPQLFYRDVNNYIQGVSATNMSAIMLSNMMSQAPALMYDNVDARIYGVDANWRYHINECWAADGTLSYVRGERKDVADNLYRLSPANARFTLRYRPARLNNRAELGLEVHAYAKQRWVSDYNSEEQSSGYALLNLLGSWSISDSTVVQAGVSNLLDRAYHSHVAGSNRIAGSDIALGEKLPGHGRTTYLRLRFSW